MFQVGDKVYYVEKDTDSEIECYIYKNMGDAIYMVKIRDNPSFGIFHEQRLTKIDPPTWETLEENLEKHNLKMDSEEENLSSPIEDKG